MAVSLESRQLAEADDVLAVQIECRRGECRGVVMFSLEDPVHANPPEHLACRLCGHDFWNPSAPSYEFGFIESLAGLRHRLPLRRFKGIQAKADCPPRVRLVLPGKVT